MYPQATIAYTRTLDLLRSFDPRGERWTEHKADLRISLHGGRSHLWFKSADKPDNLYGEDVYHAVVDEASRCKEEAWHAVRSTLTATNGALRIIGNVNGRRNWAYQLARRAESGELPDWKFGRITCYDAVKAGIIKQAQVDAARRELPEHVFRELYEGIPSDDGGNPFGIAHLQACAAPPSDNPPAYWGVDLARAQDYTVALALDADGRWCRMERWQGRTWEHTVGRLAELIGDSRACVDSTGVGDAVFESIARRCEQAQGVKFTNERKQQLIEGLAVAIQSRATTLPTDRIALTEYEAFEYTMTPSGRVRYSAPEGMHDDIVCAHALAWSCYDGEAARPKASVEFVGYDSVGDDNLGEGWTRF